MLDDINKPRHLELLVDPMDGSRYKKGDVFPVPDDVTFD